MAANLFAAAAAVVTRLREVVQPQEFEVDGTVIDRIKTVDSASVLAGQPSLLNYAPGLFVMLAGTSGAPDATADRNVVIDTRIIIVSVVVRNIPTAGALTTESQAGAYAAAVLAALNGWRPAANHGDLMFTRMDTPAYYRTGTAEFPLWFECSQAIQ